MKSMAGPRWPLRLLAAASLLDAAQAALCACLGFGGSPAGSLLQAGGSSTRPRDCTCVTGVKSYATTPRDTLLGMGEVGLRSHLRKCRRERGELEARKEYQVAAAEAQQNNVQEKLGHMKKIYEGTKNHSATQHSQAADEKAELTKQTKSQEKEVQALKKDYNAEFTAWYNGQQDLKAKLQRFWACNCKSEPTAAASFLLAGSGRGGRSGRAPTDKMYDLAHDVEECEGAVIKLSDDIDAALVKERKATAELSAGTENLRRRLEDHERMSKLVDLKPQIETLKARHETLKSIVETQRGQVEKYVEQNKKLKKQLDDLDKSLKDCKC